MAGAAQQDALETHLAVLDDRAQAHWPLFCEIASKQPARRYFENLFPLVAEMVASGGVGFNHAAILALGIELEYEDKIAAGSKSAWKRSALS